MAGPPSGDRPEKSTNGSINRLNKSNTPPSGGLDDEQTLADAEQTIADTEQTLSDSDQTSADRDQLSADTDQTASERDQAASDRDLAQGVDSDVHDATRDIRKRTARQREETAGARLDNAHERDASAQTRDLAGLARDRAAAARDLAMVQRDVIDGRDAAQAVTGAEIVVQAGEQRERAAAYRAQAAEHRESAAQDREAAAADREGGAHDRRQASADREALATALAMTEIDPLTGARTRAAGLNDFDHELDRSRRTGSSLVVAYVDVVGLKRVNDSEGHDAGDQLLTRVVTIMTEHLRTYDLVVRLAGDEFLCAMSNMTLSDARQRFSSIGGALAAGEGGAIRIGFAELTPDETGAELIARADQELIGGRRN